MVNGLRCELACVHGTRGLDFNSMVSSYLSVLRRGKCFNMCTSDRMILQIVPRNKWLDTSCTYDDDDDVKPSKTTAIFQLISLPFGGRWFDVVGFDMDLPHYFVLFLYLECKGFKFSSLTNHQPFHEVHYPYRGAPWKKKGGYAKLFP